MNEVMGSNARIYVAGHRGLVGSAITRRLQADGQPGFIAGGCIYGDAPPDLPANTGGRCRAGGVPLMVGTALGVATGITLAALRARGMAFVEADDVQSERRGALTVPQLGGVMFELVHDGRR